MIYLQVVKLKFLAKLKQKSKQSKPGYAVLIVGVLFSVGMVVVSTQIARTTISYQRTVGNTLQENISGNFADNIANRLVSRFMKFGSGYYELGKTIDFTQEGNKVRDAIGLLPSSFGDGNNDVVIDYDFIGASIVPVPSAYDFSGNNAGNNFTGNVTEKLSHNGVDNRSVAEYGFYDENNNEVCDPDANSNYGKATDYNIFKRSDANPKEYESSFLPNFRCPGEEGSVYLADVSFDDTARSGTQRIVTRKNTGRSPNFYYTVPALGTGDAGTECTPHQVKLEDRWNGTQEYIDPLDYPCNWNVMEKGESIKIGLGSYSQDEVIQKTRNEFGGVDSLALRGSNLEADVQNILNQSYYEKINENDVLILRIRLRCVDGSGDCHPSERYEFFDREFLNEFETRTHDECVEVGCTHSYRTMAQHNLNEPEFDFTPLVFGYGLSDGDRFLPMRGDYNLAEQRRLRFNTITPSIPFNFESEILPLSRNNNFSQISINKLRGKYQPTAKFDFDTKGDRIGVFNNRLDYQFSYDNQNRISNVLINNLEFPYQEQGFRFDYDNDYFHLYLLDSPGYENDLKNPEFVLTALDDFIEVIQRQNFNATNPGKTYNRLEYQIVSDRIIGLDEGYLIYDYGFGKKINKNKYNVSGISDTGFVNTSN